jgi:hypothetical protein
MRCLPNRTKLIGRLKEMSRCPIGTTVQPGEPHANRTSALSDCVRFVRLGDRAKTKPPTLAKNISSHCRGVSEHPASSASRQVRFWLGCSSVVRDYDHEPI